MSDFLDFFLHLDDKLAAIIADYGTTTYVILFLIIFIETGVVIWPFLPGDSLLFAAGTFAALGSLNIALLIIILFIAAFLGDTVNYLIGKHLGLRILQKKRKNGKQLIKQEYIDKTHGFFDKHGPKTIILARFVPIVRTFAPFVAGIGQMNYGKFISYNVIGGAIWVVGLSLLGYFFGTIPFVQKNFEIVILGIIFISIVPIIIELIRHKMKKKK
jgi:membrane-associated protein